jgi:hypothetical protein
MAHVVIDDPILNSPFTEPTRHFKFDAFMAHERGDAARLTTARTLWVPAVNNHGGFGRWAFVEVTDPWDAQRAIRAAVQATGVEAC